MDWDEMLRQLNPAITVLDAALRWRGDTDSIRHIRTGVNATFRFEVNGTGHYLRLTHNSLISERKVSSALNYLCHLWREGAAVCEPVASRNGSFLESIPLHDATEPLPDGGQWLATVTKEVAGSPIGLNTTDLAAYEAWGRSLGTLHRAARTYTPKPEFVFADGSRERRNAWAQYKQNIPPFDTLALREYEQLDEWGRQLPATEENPDFGLTHGDCNSQNFLWTGRTVFVIDFDEPSYNWFAADIARALVEFGWREQRNEFRTCFIQGYRSAYDFSPYWEERLTHLMRLFALGNYIEVNPYPTLEALTGADKDGADRPWDFYWCLRKRFADPTLWEKQ